MAIGGRSVLYLSTQLIHIHYATVVRLSLGEVSPESLTRYIQLEIVQS